VDNDCDGKIDEDFVATACGIETGECIAGAYQCVGGTKVCQGGTGPKAELCDNKDNDCDGQDDEDFDKLSDPRYCGSSCTTCKMANAIAKCTNGSCDIAVCLNGWVDLDKLKSNGCEYKCIPTGVEICDGLDNDCNGKIDAQDPAMVTLGSSPCYAMGSCAGATASCQGTSGWVCTYGADVELKACSAPKDCLTSLCKGGFCSGEVASEETKCDAKDNDCDGLADESFPTKGKSCTEQGKLGVCQGSGSWICDASGKSTICNITSPGGTPGNELCNGKDDDCDGVIDEEANDATYKGVVDAMVRIQRMYKGVSYDYYIYTYEASRPDAVSGEGGSLTTRACSKGNVQPWSDVTYAEAAAACAAAGKRLCSGAEWFLACSGAANDPAGCTKTIGDGCYYPYGDTYNKTSCNGQDLAPLTNAMRNTGATLSCLSPDKAFDLSGNLKEWTNDPQSDGKAPDPDGYTVRGGAYDSTYFGMRCDFTFTVMPPIFSFPNLGFRCCSNTPP
jgi:hypothetical protein